MPKVSKAGKFRKAASKPKEEKQAAPAALSRGQRKRQAKREQYLKRETMILSTLQLKQQEEQKKRIDGLGALKEALTSVDTSPSTSAATAQQPSNTLKGKKNLAAREMEHMNLVLQHPAFLSNPFEAIQQHLRNSLAGQAQEQEAKSRERAKVDMDKQQVKKRQKKERIQAAGGRHRKKFHAARKT